MVIFALVLNAVLADETVEEAFEKGRANYNQHDYVEAVKWCRRSAEQGCAEAQCILGICYDNGQGVSQDDAEAAKWYRKAADQGHARAQYNLGCCYEKGEGVMRDDAEAAKWYRKAAEQGHCGAIAMLERLEQ